ncbi:MAG: UDP-galactopyranose mutase [Provencibacterium sp.]|jgi:UDP-galactopyranose mutase|nr:UDP-galactopyranose mutase [Provencibacterium sp.]
MYDYLIVGAGLFGSVFAHEAALYGKSCLVIDRRPHIGGNVYTEPMHGIPVHQYGAHIFHTSNPQIWEYVQRLGEFHPYINSPIAVYRGELYNLPFNMNTFSRMWGIRRPHEAKRIIAEQAQKENIANPQNLEEHVLSMVGRDIYEKLVKEYTEKQWGRPCSELPPFIIKRLPIRFTYDNNYFNDRYQGIPAGGYTLLIEKLLEKAEVQTSTDFFELRRQGGKPAKKILYTGMLDAYFDYRLGPLEYRSLRFETSYLPEENYQGNAVVNYTSAEAPYTRIIEHKHFYSSTQPGTVITKEYPCEWTPGAEPYYPINDARNNALAEQYRQLAAKEPDVLFGGRLADYQYYDMDKTIEAALRLAGREFGEDGKGLKA